MLIFDFLIADYGGNRRNAIVQPYNPNRIAPILSFKSFMQQQRDDLPPETFQRMYDQYHLNYLQDFSDRFFEESMMEEWFQDRYSPVRIFAQQEATAARAGTESAALKASLLAHPAASVRAMSLEPPANANPHQKGKRGPVFEKVEVVEATAAASGDMEVSAASDVPIATKHIPGHEDRTLYFSGIHASCTRSALWNAIVHALSPPVDAEAPADQEETPLPERFLFAQPVWTNFDGNDKFERFAWAVFPTSAAAKQALRKLNELRVEVPYPQDPSEADPVIEFSFTVHARPHMPKLFFEKFESCAHHLRVEADTVRAVELAALLDEDHGVPEEFRLGAILQEEAVVGALAKPTDRLDVAIGYLRRVHLVNFYGAKRFRDEAHLLSISPSVSYRIKEYVPPPTAAEASAAAAPTSSAMEEDAKPAEAEGEAPSRGKRKHEDGDGEEGETVSSVTVEAGGAAAAVPAAGGMEVEGSASKPPPPPGRPGRLVVVANVRVEAILTELREKVALARKRAEDPSVSAPLDEEEAKTLAALQDKTFERAVQSSLKPEKEGKCRCCYVSCNKLFKGPEFLAKHMRLKHEDFAAEQLLQDAKPFMRRRYEAEPMSARPLPPVEVEAHGRTELKSVKLILDKYMPQSAAGAAGAAPVPREHRDRDQAQQQSYPRRGGGGGGDGRRGHDDRDRRSAPPQPHGNAPAPAPIRQQVQYVQPQPEQNFSRKIASYVDVDAPKVSTKRSAVPVVQRVCAAVESTI